MNMMEVMVLDVFVQIIADTFLLASKPKKHICNFQNTRKKSPYGTWKCDKCDLIFETRR